jgi:integral membrane sensor domain MASE1
MADLRQEVVVTDIRMPFWSMVTFMVKWAVASIPAIIILFVLGVILASILGGVGMMHR